MSRAKWKTFAGLVCLVVASALTIMTDMTPTTSASQMVQPVGELYGVVVGVSNYLQIDDLSTPDDGAQQISHQLKEIWGARVHLRILLNQNATRNRVGEAIYWLSSSVDEKDLVMFYFTGHGDAEGLAPYDALEDSSTNDITAALLDRWLDALDSKRVFVVIDSCRAGSHAQALARNGRVILASCGEDRDAKGELSNRIVQAFLHPEALDANHDSAISVEELLEKIAYQTRSNHPYFFDGCPGELQLVSISSPVS